MNNFEVLYTLERMIQLALTDKLPEVETIIVKHTRELGKGVFACKEAEISSLKELADYISKLAKSEDKITNIRISGCIPD